MSYHPTLTDRGLFWFGGSLAALLTTLGLLISWRTSQPLYFYLALALALGTGIVFYAVPATRRPLYNGFTWLTYPIQLLATWVLLGIVYFGILTPIGIFLRLRGYDSLRRRSRWEALDREHRRVTDASYWIEREEVQDPQRYFKTY